MEMESGNLVPFLDVLVYRKGTVLLMFKGNPHILVAIFTLILTTLLMLKGKW
jgi:hypothetical protein